MTEFKRYPFAVSAENLKKFAQRYPQQAGVNGVNTSHPGQNMGMSIEELQSLIANSEKVIATAFQSAAGEVNPTITFPSTAKYLLGFTFSKITNQADTFALTINEEKAITLASATSYSVRDGAPYSSYYEFVRVIGGSTSVNLKYFSAVGGENLVITFHYV